MDAGLLAAVSLQPLLFLRKLLSSDATSILRFGAARFVYS